MSLEQVLNEDAESSVRMPWGVDDTSASRSTRTVFRKDTLKHRRTMRAADTADINTESSPSTGPTSAEPLPTGVVRLPVSVLEPPIEIKLQEWEGQVQEVGPYFFTAHLVDLTANETEETEEAELPIDDLTESDRSLLVPGAVFRWLIGYRYIRGSKERFTRFVIRRLPVWTRDEIKSADAEAEELHNALFGNIKDRATAAGRD